MAGSHASMCRSSASQYSSGDRLRSAKRRLNSWIVKSVSDMALSSGPVVSNTDGTRLARVEHVAQPIAKHVEAEDAECDGKAGQDGQPWRERQVGLRVGQHTAPGRGGWCDPEAKEAEPGLRQHGQAQLDRHLDNDLAHDVREHVAD